MVLAVPGWADADVPPAGLRPPTTHRRHRFSLLGRALGYWLDFMETVRRKRSAVAAAELQFGHSLVRAWHRAAGRSAAIRRGVEGMQARCAHHTGSSTAA